MRRRDGVTGRNGENAMTKETTMSIDEAIEAGGIILLMKLWTVSCREKVTLTYSQTGLVFRCGKLVFRGKDIFELNQKIKDFMRSIKKQRKTGENK